jgi:hypothetical protein
MSEKVDWNRYGVDEKGCARDARCESCMMHSGFEPTAALSSSLGDSWKNLKYNFGSKPQPYPASPELAKRAYNGVSIGKGHLAEAKAAINSPRAAMNGAQAAYMRKETAHDHGGTGGNCGTGDTTQRDELLAKIEAAKKGA